MLCSELASSARLGGVGFAAFAERPERLIREVLAQNPALPTSVWARLWSGCDVAGLDGGGSLRALLLRRSLSDVQLEAVRDALSRPGGISDAELVAFLDANLPSPQLWAELVGSRGQLRCWEGGGLREALATSELVPAALADPLVESMGALERVRWAIDHRDDVSRAAEVVAAQRFRRVGRGLYDALTLLALFAPEVAGAVADLIVDGSPAAASREVLKVQLCAGLRVWDTNPGVCRWLFGQLGSVRASEVTVGAAQTMPLKDPTLPAALAAAMCAHFDVVDLWDRTAVLDPDDALERVCEGWPLLHAPLLALAAADPEVHALAVKRFAPAVQYGGEDHLALFEALRAGRRIGVRSSGLGTYTGPGCWGEWVHRKWPSWPGLPSQSQAALRVLSVCGDDPVRWALFFELVDANSDVDVDVDDLCAVIDVAFT